MTEDNAMWAGGLVRAGAMTETAKQTPPSLPNVTNPTLEEMSKERDPGPAVSEGRHTVSLASMELQQGEVFTPSKVVGGIERQCYIRCNSNAWKTYQGSNACHWHGPVSIFPKGAIHASASALLVSFGGRKALKGPPLDSVEDKKKVLDKIRTEKKCCTPAPKGGSNEERTEPAACGTGQHWRMTRRTIVQACCVSTGWD